MVDLTQAIPVAKKLNEKSNQINVVINAVNEKLEKLNIGLEVWLDERPLVVSPCREQDDGTRRRDVACLGYGNMEDRWQLLVRHVVEELKPNDEEYCEEIDASFQPLLKAPRNLRITALERLDRLISKLTTTAETVIATIEKAEEVAGDVTSGEEETEEFISRAKRLEAEVRELTQFFKNNPKSKRNVGFYLDRYGELCRAETENEELTDLSALAAGQPNFEVVFFNAKWPSGMWQGGLKKPVSIQQVLKEAEEERMRFYTDREKEFGPDAWPKAAGGR